MTVRGIRNNNPGNIKHSDKYTWKGEIGIDDKGFVIFDKVEHGIRAMTKILLTYYRVHKLDTVAKIIPRWAPPTENDTEAYKRSVCKTACVGQDEVLAMTSLATMTDIVIAIIKQEIGSNPFALMQVIAGINMALEGVAA